VPIEDDRQGEPNRGATNYGTSTYATLYRPSTRRRSTRRHQTLWKPADKLVAITWNSDKAAYSTDGINWTAATMPSSVDWYVVAYGGE
jgi:hypothetical protein